MTGTAYAPAHRLAAEPLSRNGGRAWLASAAVLTLCAFVVRGGLFGDPLIHVDENFYLWVGDRLLRGELPYVDVWDRKPVGLFVLYAAIRLLGGDGIVQYQVVATLFAAATAWVVARIAAPAAGIAGGTAAGVLYLLMIGLAGGAGGQAPVFYNLFVAAAAWASQRALLDGEAAPAQVRGLGCAAMALVGQAMQLKYTAVFEGVFLGLALLWASWRAGEARAGEGRAGRMGRTAADAALWIGLALAPTLAALVWYAALGEAQAFVYANFLSIGARSGASAAELAHRLRNTGELMVGPVLALGLALWLKPWRRFAGGAEAQGFALLWLASAVAGYALFGTYFNHYALPLIAPLAVCVAPLFGVRERRLGAAAVALMLVVGAVANAVAISQARLKRGGEAQMAQMLAAIRPRLTNCLYVWNGDSILYHLTGSCAPTRYAFAGHLNLLRENGAVGVDQATEVRRILAGRPSVIVDRLPRAADMNPAVIAIVDAELARAYAPVAVIPLKKARLLVYERRPLRP